MSSLTAMQASMQARHDAAHMRHTSLSAACSAHASMHARHISMQASSIAIIDAGVMPCMRSIERIIVPHMSAQFMHSGAHDISCVAHTVHACSHAAHASRQACMSGMSIASIPGIAIMSFDMASFIMASIPHPASVSDDGPACPPGAHGRPRIGRAEGAIRLEDVPIPTTPTSFARQSAALWAGLALAAASVLLIASPAAAHDELSSTDPAAGATLDALPAQLTLTFSADIAPDAGASEVVVTDAAGAALVDGAPVAEGAVLTQALAGEASGAVTVLWKVVSSDGHPISGELSFTVTPASTPTPTATATPTTGPTPPTEPTLEPTAEPSAVPADDAGSSFSDVWPWVVGGLIVIALGGGVVYLLASRARRQKALEEARVSARDAARDGSEPPAAQ